VSGFGALGVAAPVSTATRPEDETRTTARNEAEAARQRLEELNAAVSAAERAKAEADDMLSERRAHLVGARQRRDEALASLRAAERELNTARTATTRQSKPAVPRGIVKEARKEATAQRKRA